MAMLKKKFQSSIINSFGCRKRETERALKVLLAQQQQWITRGAFASECKDASLEAGMTLKTEESLLRKAYAP